MAAKTTYDFDMMLSNAREAYGEELYKMAKEGKDFVFTYSDNVAPSSSAGKLLKEFPERCFNFGIAEPNQVGASAGLALYRAIPNLTVVVPADANQCCKFIRQSMDYEGPMIIRIDRAGSPNVYAEDYDLVIGKAIETLEGTDAYIISCGSNLYECLMAAKMMKEKYGSSIGILDMHTIKPLDAQSIIRVAEKTGNIVTVEDHSVNGGLGGAVAEVLCEAGYKGSFKRVGMPDEFAVLGSVDAIYHYYGMDRDGIVKVLENMLRLGK